MEEEVKVLTMCNKLLMAYQKCIHNTPNITTEEVVKKVQISAEAYILESSTEFATQMIGNIVYHIIELETARMEDKKKHEENLH